MHFTLSVMAALAAATPAFSQEAFPKCIQSCFGEGAPSSQCNGDEKGEALAKCTCSSLEGTDLLSCITDCPPSDQGEYIKLFPGGDCMKELFPDADSGSGSSTATATGASSPSATDGSSEPSKTGDSSEPSKTDGSSEPSQTDDSSSPTDTGAAAGINAPALMAAGGLVAAFFA